MTTRLTQLYRHAPEKGYWGDCFRTCVAMLLGYERPDIVPHFCDKGAPDAEAKANAWLSIRSLRLLEVNWTGNLEGVLNWHAEMQPGMSYILTGTSRNGTNHAVVAMGGAIFCDPSIDQSGIIGPASDGLFWTTYLVYQPKKGGS